MKLSALATAAALATNFLPAMAVIKVMPFGDSITEWGCWRQKLYSSLQTAGYTDIDFIGSVTSPDNQCPSSIPYDKHNEGHAGFLATDIANKNQLVGWLAPSKADVVIMHLGTNDLFYSKSVNDIINAFSKLLDQMRASNPKTILVVAKIIPSTYITQQVSVNLNNAIGTWAASKNTTASPITLVDLYTGFNGQSDNKDGVHPNDSGDTKIANNLFAPVKAALNLARTFVG